MQTRAVRSPLRYPGGKQKAIASISAMLPKGCEEYREPMLGGGSAFFHARSIGLAKHYWLNDLFRELYCFWKTVQDDELCERLCEELHQLRNSFSSVEEIKDYFLSQRHRRPKSEFETAKLFFFFNRVTFSGTTKAGGFSEAAAINRFTASSIERLRPLPAALSNVRITNTDFKDIVTADGADVFMFIDPPYVTAQRLYGPKGELHQFDHEQLAHLLRKTQHRFLITYDDCDDVRRLYNWRGVRVVPWSLQYGMNNCNNENLSKLGAEVFVLNYCVD